MRRGDEVSADQVLSCTDPKKLFGDDIIAGFRSLAQEWHPDKSKDPRAQEVLQHLLELREAGKRGLKLGGAKEEKVAVAGGTLLFGMDEIVLSSPSGGCATARACLSFLEKASPDLSRRVPKVIDTSTDDGVLRMQRLPDTVSMAHVMQKHPGGLPQYHVAWMTSRLFELVMETSKIGGCIVGGLTPESLLVMVGEHGVIPVDWRFTLSLRSTVRKLPGPLVPDASDSASSRSKPTRGPYPPGTSTSGTRSSRTRTWHGSWRTARSCGQRSRTPGNIHVSTRQPRRAVCPVPTAIAGARGGDGYQSRAHARLPDQGDHPPPRDAQARRRRRRRLVKPGWLHLHRPRTIHHALGRGRPRHHRIPHRQET